MPTPRRAVLAATTSALLALGLAACGAGAAETAGTSGDRVDVTVAFYPLEYVTQRIGGTHVQVSDLTKPGAEPHDLEPTPRDVAGLTQADLVVTVGGFQPAVDAGVRTAAPQHVLDVQGPARLDRTYTPIEDGEVAQDEQGARDPHFWLDPVRLAAVSGAVAAQAQRVDPAHAADYRANLAALQRDLTALDGDLRAGLAHCADRDVVTSHNAFGYLAERYGLTQVGITGISPEGEVSARRSRASPTSCGRTGCAPSTPRPWSARRSPTRSRARRVPAPRCSTPSRGSPTAPRAATTCR
ncbi:hypothetical protein GCM10025868_08580 [Angustibacter aerolatus]|uniref:Zinc transport system substrate-binding protein n=1 Tax=Angustibacter aerolatus TaxID=1162965 RepID=A0ABQ6JDW7_9ACTN|nr:hypothetical protein GCM10025868_08580 [Angustibacter aerolatus]